MCLYSTHDASSSGSPLNLMCRLPLPPPIGAAQVQYSLLDRRPENGMVEYCREAGIKLLPYGVLAGGLLTDKYLGASVSE